MAYEELPRPDRDKVESLIYRLKISGYSEVRGEEKRAAFRYAASSEAGQKTLNGDTSYEVTRTHESQTVRAALDFIEERDADRSVTAEQTLNERVRAALNEAARTGPTGRAR